MFQVSVCVVVVVVAAVGVDVVVAGAVGCKKVKQICPFFGVCCRVRLRSLGQRIWVKGVLHACAVDGCVELKKEDRE